MKNIILYFAIKYNGNWEKIYDAISKKEHANYKHALLLKEEITKRWITLLDDDYPEELKTILKPPFILFLEGNDKLLNKDNWKVSLIDDGLEESDFKSIEQNLKDFTFIVQYEKYEIIENLIKFGANIIAVSKKGLQNIENDFLYRMLIDTKNLVVSEALECDTKDITKSFYHDRLQTGLSQKVLCISDIEKCKIPLITLLSDEKVPIYSMMHKKIDNVKLIKIKSLKEFRKLNLDS